MDYNALTVGMVLIGVFCFFGLIGAALTTYICLKRRFYQRDRDVWDAYMLDLLGMDDVDRLEQLAFNVYPHRASWHEEAKYMELSQLGNDAVVSLAGELARQKGLTPSDVTIRRLTAFHDISVWLMQTHEMPAPRKIRDSYETCLAHQGGNAANRNFVAREFSQLPHQEQISAFRLLAVYKHLRVPPATTLGRNRAAYELRAGGVSWLVLENVAEGHKMRFVTLTRTPVGVEPPLPEHVLRGPKQQPSNSCVQPKDIETATANEQMPLTEMTS